MKRISLLLILLSALSLENPSFAQAPILQDEIAAYNKGDYRDVITIGRQLTSQNFSDGTAHYYMANAYVNLGQPVEAREEYTFCLQTTQDPQLRAYCDQGLNLLLGVESNSSSNQYSNAQNNQVAQNNRAIVGQVATTKQWFRAPEKSLSKNDPNYTSIIANMRTTEQQRINEVRHAVNTPIVQSYSHSPNPPNLIVLNPNLPGYVSSGAATNAIYPRAAYTDAQYPSIPGFQQYSALFNASPLPPPPFPASALKGAETALGRKIN